MNCNFMSTNECSTVEEAATHSVTSDATSTFEPDKHFSIHQSKRTRFDRTVCDSTSFQPDEIFSRKSNDAESHIPKKHSTNLTERYVSATDRLTELSAIINECSHVELVHLHEAITPLLKRDFLLLLPLELSLHILSYLSLRDVLRCAQVSRYWHRVVSDPLLWYQMCRRDGIFEASSFPSFVQNNYYSTVGRHDGAASFSPENCDSLNAQGDSSINTAPSVLTDAFEGRSSHSLKRDWKAVYRHSLETRCNWHNGSPWAPIILNAHHNHVITCLEVYNDWAITGSDDSSICIWSLTRGELLINLFGHIGGVWSLAVLPSVIKLAGVEAPLLVSGSCDRTARVWLLDGSRWPCLTTLFGHQSTVRCLAGQRNGERGWNNHVGQVQASSDPQTASGSTEPLENQSGYGHNGSCLVVTGSRDTTLRLWNALSGQCLCAFQGHRGAVRCVQFCGTLVVSGSYDCTVRVWCTVSGTCVRILNGHKNRVYTLLFDGCRIISASLDTTICVWDVKTGRVKHTFCGHRSLTSEMAYGHTQRILVSSNADETIRVWDVETGECLHVLAGRHKHLSAVTCVQLTRHFIVSSGDDGTVKLWDRHTGAFIRDLVRLDGAGRGGVIWRIVSSEHRLVCAAGSRNGLETTKLVILQFGEPLESATDSPLRHICRSKPQHAPVPKLSQVVAAHDFEVESSLDTLSQSSSDV